MRTSSPPAILSEASTSSQTALQTPDRNEIFSDFSSSQSQASGMNMTELELLHNYSTSTAYTLSRHPVVQSVWRVTVPQIGFSSTYVMRAILALSALHLAYYRPTQKDFYIGQALLLHETALRMANPILPDITQENCSSLYLFAALTCLISCAKPRIPGDLLLVGESGISEWLILFRGTRLIIYSAIETLRSGPLGPMFSIGSRRVELRETSSGANNDVHLLELQRLIKETVTEQKLLETYDTAIHEIGKSFVTINSLESERCEITDVFIWLLGVSEEFLGLLSQRQPEALCIVAYFSVVLHRLNSVWWIEGWSTHLISSIYHALDHEHQHWIQWPIEQLGWKPG